MLLKAGAKTIASIVDYRSNEKKCGYVKCIRFQWFQTESFITTIVDINAVGEYYIAWVGRSNNTHPIIKEIRIQEG